MFYINKYVNKFKFEIKLKNILHFVKKIMGAMHPLS